MRPEKILIPLLLLFFFAALYIIFAPAFPTHKYPDKIGRAISELRILSNALDLFHADNARYPTTTEGLNALVTNPNHPTRHGPYLLRLHTDPRTNPKRYTSPARDGKLYQLSSHGPDTLPNTPDDLTPDSE